MIYDRLQSDFTNREMTKEGYMLVRDSKIACVGVLTYDQAELGDIEGMPSNRRGTKIRVQRNASDLLSEKTLNTFKSKPITVLHPSQGVTASTVMGEMKGMLKDNISQDGKYMMGDLLIMDTDTIKLVEDGTKELSLGYTVDITWDPTDDYDAVMSNYEGNHIAIVPRGRCGSEVKISDSNKNKGTNMKKVKIGDVEYDASPELAFAFDKYVADAEAVKKEDDEKNESELKEKDDKIADTEAEKDKLEAKVDGMEKDKEEDDKKKIGDADISALVSARVELESKAKSIIGDTADFKDKSNKEVMALAVTARNGMTIGDKSDDYVLAIFDHVCADVKIKTTKDIADSAPAKSMSQLKREEIIENNKKKWSK